MKKTLVTIIILFSVTACFSQESTSQTALDSMSKKVIYYFQIKQADSIYALAGENFRSQLTLENFRSVSQNQIFPLNDFKQVTFLKTQNGINTYKVSGSPDLQLLVGLDKQNKLETLLIQPFSAN